MTSVTSRDGEVCGPDARCWLKFVRRKNFSGATVARKAVQQGRAQKKQLKPIAREGRDASAETYAALGVFSDVLHTRPRVQRAPGLSLRPIVRLEGGKYDGQKLGAASRRECDSRGGCRHALFEIEISR